MADHREDSEVFWVEPRERAIIPLPSFVPSRSLATTVRRDRFEVTLDRDFEGVMEACAQPRPGHPESWISHRIQASYVALHRVGRAHSVECRVDGTLVGGLYGVAFDRVFCGESMFSRADNASKVALVWLVALLRRAGYVLLDCQFMTDHLATLGAVALPQARYVEMLAAARGEPRMSLGEAYASFSSSSPEGFGSGPSPGKLIAQSLTQTS